MKKVLLLTVTAGEGHNSVAKALRDKFESLPDVKVKVVDIFKEYSNKLKVFFIDDGYRAACKYTLSAYNMIYKALQARDPEKRETSPAQKTVEKETPFILKEIVDYKPDVIVCSHFYGAIALTNLRKIYPINAKIGAILTDYCVHPFWEAATGIDYIFTPCEDVEETLLEKGFAKDQIVCYGLPVKEKFGIKLDRDECRAKLGLDKDAFTVMLMTGGGGFGGILTLFRNLTKVKQKIQIISINGKDKVSKERIASIIKTSKSGHIFHNLGFVTNIEEYMSASDCMVGKCGGISSTESLCEELPLISISKLAEQELGNLRFLQEKECCLTIDANHKVNKLVEDLINNPEKLEKMRQNIRKIKKPTAITDICVKMIEGDNADYGVLSLVQKISNKEVMKSLQTAKRNYIKGHKVRVNAVKLKSKLEEKHIKEIKILNKKSETKTKVASK